MNWEIIKGEDLKAPEIVEAAKAALNTYEAENGKKYTYYEVIRAMKIGVNGLHYNITFSADYIPSQRKNAKSKFLECYALVNKNLESKIDVISAICEPKIKASQQK